MRVYATDTYPDVNWHIAPGRTGRENAIIERLLDDIRLSHSVVQEN